MIFLQKWDAPDQSFLHSREETRYCMMLSDIQKKIDPEGKWKDLLSIGRQDAMRVVKGLPTIETRYFMPLSPK